MSEVHVYPVPEAFAAKSLCNAKQYGEMYKRSVEDPEGFWGEHGKRITWFKPYTKVKNTTFDKPHVSIKWYEDGTLNASYNCIDRHLEKRGDQVAIIWEGDDPSVDKKITYKQLHEEVSRLANAMT
ncbi:MAG: acetyl-coenzyme A synthetase N-terminal domain-containing protein, partial [Rhodospirillaceae bacterium]